jgi:putative glutamine amidotransferase
MIVQRPYTDAILEAGGLPLVPPPLPNTVDDDACAQLIAMADALVLPGGGFDIDPALYGEAVLPACGELKPERTQLERNLLLHAQRRGIPVLGVCGGMQLMNVVRGGTLFQDLPSQRKTPTLHTQVNSKALPAHTVTVVASSSLGRIVGSDAPSLPVNSTHHQAVKTLAHSLVANAFADDGLIEGLEDPHHPFFVGVQWHPESMNELAHRAIYRGLIDAAVSMSKHL